MSTDPELDPDEIDFEQAVPIDSKPVTERIIEHFEKPLEEEVKDLGMLEYGELCEGLLREYAKAVEMEKACAEIVKARRAEILKLAGKDRGTKAYGKAILTLKDVRGRESVDWKAYFRDTIGDAEIPETYRKRSDDGVRVEVKIVT